MRHITALFFFVLATVGSVYAICEYAFPVDDNFTALVQTYNTYSQEEYLLPPIEYLACTTAEEFSDYIRNEHRNVKFAVSGGRHSYGSFSYGGKETRGSLPYTVLSTKLLTEVSVRITDQGDSVLEIGAGVHMLDIIPFLANNTKLWFFGGSCPTVKLTGFTLSGGYTFVVRTYGMVADYVESMDVVLWNGTVTQASKTQNTDLYWGLLGGGSVGRFALVTTYRYTLTPAPPAITSVTYHWPWVRNSSTLIPFLQLWMRVAPRMDNRCSISLSLNGGKNPFINFRGMCEADLATSRELLSPFLSNSSIWPSPNPIVSDFFESDWVTGSYYLDGCVTYEECKRQVNLQPYDDAMLDGSNGWKSTAWYGYKELTKDGWQGLLDLSYTLCEGTEYLCGALLTPDGPNSRTCTNPSDNAFPPAHRCALYHMEFLAYFNVSHQDDTQLRLSKYDTAYAKLKQLDRDNLKEEPYSGYVDKDFCDEYEQDGEWAMMMYGQNFTHVDRLCDVRCKYDPQERAATPCSFDFCYCDDRM